MVTVLAMAVVIDADDNDCVCAEDGNGGDVIMLNGDVDVDAVNGG